MLKAECKVCAPMGYTV